MNEPLHSKRNISTKMSMQSNNLAYSKKVFESVRGFKSHYSLPSGDDDLFIQEAAVNQNYTIQISPETFCYSKAAETWKGWVRQKTRQAGSSKCATL